MSHPQRQSDVTFWVLLASREHVLAKQALRVAQH